MSQLPSGWISEKNIEEDLLNMQTDVLSARCTADRLRLKAPLSKVVRATSRECLEKLIADLRVVHSYIADIQKAHSSHGKNSIA